MKNFNMRTVSDCAQLPVPEGTSAKLAEVSRTRTSSGSDYISLTVGNTTISLEGPTVIQQVEAIITLLELIKAADCSIPEEGLFHA